MRVKVTELAHKNGITVLQLSEKTNISERTLYRWNAGKTKPNKSNIDILTKNFNCKEKDLFEFI